MEIFCIKNQMGNLKEIPSLCKYIKNKENTLTYLEKTI